MSRSFYILIFVVLTVNLFSQNGKIKIVKPKTYSATIAGIQNGSLSKETLLNVKGFDVDTLLKITSFEMSYVGHLGVIELEGNGFFISAQMRGLFTKCEIGDKLFFENIKAIGPGGILYKLPAISLKIK